MVNLIITLISIALIAIVAVATLYNGGDAFRQGSSQASAAQLVNAGQQISAANILYANNNSGSYATDISQLTDGGAYLSSVPRVPNGFTVDGDITGNVITVTNADLSPEVCTAVNKQAGYAEGAEPTDADGVTLVFGCFEATGDTVFIFR